MCDQLTCIALDSERDSPDLRLLSDLADVVQWVQLSEAAKTRAALLMSGLWATESATQAKPLLSERCATGLLTVIVPRFRTCDFTTVLSAPSPVRVVPAEFKSFEWGAQHYAIPGFTVIRTSLHAGKLGEAPGVGTVLLAFRPHLAAGAVILCTAVLASRVIGVDSDMQRNLLQKIVESAEQATKIDTESIETPSTKISSSIDEFLRQEHEIGAAYLMCRLLEKSYRYGTLSELAKECLGIELAQEDCDRLKRRLPAATSAEIGAALEKAGWIAYLRRLGLTTQSEPMGE